MPIALPPPTPTNPRRTRFAASWLACGPAVTVAMRNKMDLALGVAVGSSIQIALFAMYGGKGRAWWLASLRPTACVHGALNRQHQQQG